MTHHKDISETVLREIQKKGIAPASRWHERIGKALFWVLAFLSLAVGMLSFSVILFFVLNDTLDFYNQLGLLFVLRALPYFWFIALGAFVFIGKYYYRKTTFGHRRSILAILGVYLLFTITGGSLAYAFGIGDRIEQQIQTHIPLYRNIVNTKENTWNQPEKGLLAGKIVSVSSSEIKLQSIDGVLWSVHIANATKRGSVMLSVGEQVKMFGHQSGDARFDANEVRPWLGRGEMRGVGNRGMR